MDNDTTGCGAICGQLPGRRGSPASAGCPIGGPSGGGTLAADLAGAEAKCSRLRAGRSVAIGWSGPSSIRASSVGVAEARRIWASDSAISKRAASERAEANSNLADLVSPCASRSSSRKRSSILWVAENSLTHFAPSEANLTCASARSEASCDSRLLASCNCSLTCESSVLKVPSRHSRSRKASRWLSMAASRCCSTSARSASAAATRLQCSCGSGRPSISAFNACSSACKMQ
mmetsp:Transcript_40616/g.117445  ORF Transcript_40616/g.117445 Transcript_40616/m.117445 type:complete len:233 (+) Transcript_40616:631-1329(+)